MVQFNVAINTFRYTYNL